ncbi:tyrosine-protein phosphatase [Rhizobium setariae]|uniref:tyrosine-protein phosphatase n=1 Tax=Rhizobium setariae TaxID=2801340 RepID=UPI001FEE8F3B|nr:tyrosine-protein phosphatase [Rhizobium setariae]
MGVEQLRANFHEVDPGYLYRSGQLTPAQLRDYANRFGIRSIVNLRGRSEKADWYKGEVAEAKALGITHVDFKMSATKELPLNKADELEKILREVPKPVLIHCQAGADRSGLASAIFMQRIRGAGIEKAEGQISLYYGHFSIPVVSQAYPMDETWEKLEDIYSAREREARL